MFGMFGLNLAALAGVGLLAVLGPLVTYGAMAVREKIAVTSNVKAERRLQDSACQVRIEDVVRARNGEIDAAVRQAREAANAIDATPEDAAEISKLCARSASCRSQAALLSTRGAVQ